jgi:uncharacterized alkaline shock family protein YloU
MRTDAAAIGLAAKEDRGTTEISPAVVEKIAGRAAREVEGVSLVAAGGIAARIASLVGNEGRASASADVGRTTSAIDLTVSIRYPQPILEMAERVRSHVKQRVHELTGLEVQEVDITVSKLDAEGPPRRRVE